MSRNDMQEEPWIVLCSENGDDELERETGEEGSGVLHCISGMLCGGDRPYKRLLETLTELRGEFDLSLPSIVVCGVQSHGKSSTLERIAQLEVFPRDSSLCTRMVVRLMLRNSSGKKVTKVRVFDTVENKGMRPSWTDIPEGMPVPDATRAIMRDFVNSKHKGVKNAIDGRHELQVMLQAPNVPTIDLVDLPGIDSLTEDAAPMLLAKQFLAKEDTLVVAIACASDKQIGASAIWRLLSETESPAVVALTHMDLSRQSKADMIDILNKQPKFVADCGTVQSVIPVVNRDTLSAGAQVSLRGALASEKAALTSKLEQIGVRFDPSQHGICAVVGALGNMLHEHMADAWGRAELSKLTLDLAPIAMELAELGVRPDVLTRDDIVEAIETAWTHLISDKGSLAALGDIAAGEINAGAPPTDLRITQAGDLEQLLSDELDGRMEAALGSVQRMLVESIQWTCAEPPVKLVRFSAIADLCKKALRDVFEADKPNIKSGIVSSTRRMIKAAMPSLDSDHGEVRALMRKARALVFTDVAYSLLRRGAFLAAVRSQLGTGVGPALVVDADASRRRELERKVELVGEAADVLSGLLSTCPETKEVVADIGKVVRASKSGCVNSDSVRACSQWLEGDLHSASADGDEALVKILLDNGADVHAKKNGGCLPLHVACRNGHEGVAKLLLDNGANVHAKKDNGSTALRVACFNGHEGVAKLLLDNDADVHAKTDNGSTPMHSACFNGHERVAKLLLDKGADVRAKDNGGALALHAACLNGHEGVAKLLLDNGADVHAKSDNGLVALHLACKSGHEGVAKLLLDNGADVHAKSNGADVHAKSNGGWLALHVACANGHKGVAKLLLDNGADVHAKKDNGSTALHIACANGHKGVAKLLLDNGADVHTKNNDGWLALHVACLNGHDGVAKLLLDNGADVHAKAKVGSTPMHVACANGHEGVAKLLLDNGADVHAKTNEGWAALYLACANGHEDIAKLLLDNGADVHAKTNKGWAALYVASKNGHDGVAKLLLDKGADVHEKDKDGNAPMHLACQNNHNGVAKLLLDNGADVHAKKDNGSTALHIACQNGHEGVAKLLLANGADVHARKGASGDALYFACQKGHEGIAKLLLDNGANVHAKTIVNETALHVACRNGREGVAKLLLDNGADLHAINDYGTSALYSARVYGHEGVAKLLVDYGADGLAKSNLSKATLTLAWRLGCKRVTELLRRLFPLLAKLSVPILYLLGVLLSLLLLRMLLMLLLDAVGGWTSVVLFVLGSMLASGGRGVDKRAARREM